MEVRDFFGLRLAMARDCTPSARGIGSRRWNFDGRQREARHVCTSMISERSEIGEKKNKTQVHTSNVLVKGDPLQIWMAEQARGRVPQAFFPGARDAVDPRCTLLPTSSVFEPNLSYAGSVFLDRTLRSLSCGCALPYR
jgi:hypothetical protein